MKIINWWIDRYSIGGLFIVSILAGLMSLFLTAHMFFNFNLGNGGGFLNKMQYKNGIAVPVKFQAPVGFNVDTTIAVKELTPSGETLYSVFGKDNFGRWLVIQGNFELGYGSDKIYYRDTIVPHHQTMNSRPPWKDSWSTITKVDIESGTVYIKPESFYNRGLLLLPQILFFFLVAYFCWQLACFLGNIQDGEMFTIGNYRKIRNMGLSVIGYQFLLFIVYLLENTYYVLVQYRSTIPNFRSPIELVAEADYHLGVSYLLAGCILLIVAKAFYKGHQLQQEQDLTV